MITFGWNQSELSRRATAYLPRVAEGQTQGHSLGRDRISGYIRGKYLPRPGALKALAEALQCKSSDLLPPGGVPSVVDEGQPRFSKAFLESINAWIAKQKEPDLT